MDTAEDESREMWAVPRSSRVRVLLLGRGRRRVERLGMVGEEEEEKGIVMDRRTRVTRQRNDIEGQ